MQEFYIESITWDTTNGSDITLYIRHKCATFRICYNADILATSPSISEQHRESYRILSKDDVGEEFVETAELLRKPFENLMSQMAINSLESAGYLHSYLYPLSFILEARVAESGHIQPHFKEALSRQKVGRPGEYVDSKFLKPHLSPLLNLGPNICSSRQVQVLATTSHLVPSRVLVDGTVYFFKLWRSGRVHGYYELESHRKILANTKTSPTLLADAHICRLHGLIIDNDDDVLQHYALDSDEENYPGTRLVGLLLTYIENKGTLDGLAPWSDCTDEDRLRWSRQIHHSVKCLHDAGVAWGDAKPENVLVDMEGDAWLIDFGGSYTLGWVDEAKQETLDGDQQGVQRIDDWLTKWSRGPVTRIKSDEGGVMR